MRYQKVSYLLVGLFVLAMFAGLLVTLAYVTGQTGVADRYTALYRDIDGVARGTPVSYQGYRIGRVAAIEPRHDGHRTEFQLTLEVQRGWPIPSDSIARLVSSGLLSSIQVDIRQGQSQKLLQPGQRLSSQERVNLFAAIDAIAGDVNQLTEQGLMPLLNRINDHVDRMAAEINRELPVILGNLRDGSGHFSRGAQATLQQIDGLLAELQLQARQLGAFLGEDNQRMVRSMLADLEQTSGRLAALSGDLEGSRRKVDALLDDSRNLVNENRQDLAYAIDDLKVSLKTVSKYSGNIARNLDTTSRNMAEFSRRIRQNPGLLLGGGNPRDTSVR